MYDHNQTLVPESFLALHARHGRILLERRELEARYETAETLALEIASVVSAIADDDVVARQEAMRAVESGLRAEPAPVSDSEAGWIMARVAELDGEARHSRR